MGECFNPRRPHGRRLFIASAVAAATEFQSAPPSRAATAPETKPTLAEIVSIRAALTGGDPGPDGSLGRVCVSIRAALTGGDKADG